MQALLSEQQNGKIPASIQTLDKSRQPEGDATVDVHWLSPNYKDALAITGKGKIIRNLPTVPGIDLIGTVRTGKDPRFHAGQEVLLTGWGIDENHQGRLAEQTRVRGGWLVAVSQGLDARKVMIISTAGLTVILYVMALGDAGVCPQDGEIAVVGTSGGASSTAVVLLHELGYQVVTVSGRGSIHEYLKSLGASRIPPRDEFAESRSLEKQVWVGAINTAGDKVLAGVLAQMNYGGCVAACNLAGGFTLSTMVMSLTLRNVRLRGVGSAVTPPAYRVQVWQRLVVSLPEPFYTQAAKEISPAEAPKFTEAIVDNQIQGRTLVKAN